jgi:kynurenine formamidase
MQNRAGAIVAGVMAAGCLAAGWAASALAQDQQPNDKPLTENWWPSEWGPDDKAGAINRITPEYVLKVLPLIKQGKTATLGKYYDRDIPAFGPRTWMLNIPGTPTGGPFGTNMLVYHDEYVATEIGQIGTQFDGPGHIGVRTSQGDLFYNGRDAQKTYQRGPGTRIIGMGDLGVEHVAEKAYVCRAILLDAPAFKGMNPLPIPTDTSSPGIVTADDVRGILQKQGLAEPNEGDCVFLYTGHGDLWKNSIWKSMDAQQRADARAKFTAGEPGFGRSACEYLAERKIAFMGGDTSANDAQPVGEIEGEAVPCHTEMQTRHGIWNIENLDFEPLLNEQVYEFVLVWAPLKMVGATGSPGNPVAIW